MKKIIIIAGIIVMFAAGAVFLLQGRGVSKQETEFKFTVLTRGDIENMVSSTGTLSATGTVEVGSQVSGTIDRVLVDYNDKVTKGQLLAVVDTTLLEASVRVAQSDVANSQAQYNQAHAEYERNKTLFDQGFISEMSLLTYKTSVETTSAGLVSAKEALKKAQSNLNYAKICSPIDGTVLERSIEAGQTIATSTSAPTLFTIAEDLTKMQIEAAVDESDIGQIKEGMSVRFTVQAYPDEEFTGAVRQIRLNPTTTQDVVNYTVIVNAGNERGLLLPGMTATVDFLVEERKDILLVPNTALSFQPPQELLEQLRQQFQPNSADRSIGQQGQIGDRGNRAERPADGEGRMRPEGPMFAQGNFGQGPADGEGRMRPGGPGGGTEENARLQMARVFYLNDAGTLSIAMFVSGLTDGVMTEVVRSQQLREGMRVITGMGTTQKESTGKSGLSLPIPGAGGPPPRGGPPPF